MPGPFKEGGGKAADARLSIARDTNATVFTVRVAVPVTRFFA